MSTTIRPEVSMKNKYWIERHRYYELKHFCLQYDIWKQAYEGLTGLAAANLDAVFSKTNSMSNPVEKCVEAREYYYTRINMIEKAADETDSSIGQYILMAVTKGYSYDILLARTSIPCCKDTYYELYRRFFWILNKIRK